MATHTPTPGASPRPTLGVGRAVGLAAVTAGAYQAAFSQDRFGPLVFVTAACLYELRRSATARRAFYAGLLAGLGVFVPQTGFLWTIFGPAAAALWLILALWHGLFTLTLHQVWRRAGGAWPLLAAPVLWCGLEYFRCEVYWLRFSWFSLGAPLAGLCPAALGTLGDYGTGCAVMATGALLAAAGTAPRPRDRRLVMAAVASVAAWLVVGVLPPKGAAAPGKSVRVAGVQLEFPGVPETVRALDDLVRTHPEAELLMLPEYSLDGPPPRVLTEWCARNHRWLLVGGKDPAGDDKYFNTAFVISPQGDVAFRQAKSVPIQFFADGEPARGQHLWESPWGPIGVAVCYDLSYRRVLDPLLRAGAQALIVPAMDVETWGGGEHRLNARMAGLRAAELGVPLLRLASSGISQLLDAEGRTLATAPFPGAGRTIAGALPLGRRAAGLPLDAWLAPGCVAGSAVIVLFLRWPDRKPGGPKVAPVPALSPVG